MPEGMLYNLL